MRKPLATCLASMLAMASLAAAARAQNWSVVETAEGNGHRLAVLGAPKPAASDVRPARFILDPGRRYQRIVGFGGALTESAAWALAQLPPERREEILRRYYDPSQGIGYTLARTHINSCDFDLGSWTGTWSLDDVPGDAALRHFSLQPMRRWMLPLIHEAQRIAGPDRFRLLASPWSPPAWMKTNDSMLHGGHLRPEYRRTWAQFLVRFVQAMNREEHIPVAYLTVQNEPQASQKWESCIYSPEEERDFVRDDLGPALASSATGVRLLILDHNRDLIREFTTTILGDAAAARYVWGTAIHWYEGEQFSAEGAAHDAFPAKHLLFTEGCCEGGSAIGAWSHAERYGENLIGDLSHWVEGWIDWNIVLDQNGGPNHVGNYCDAPVIVNTRTGAVTYGPSFDYLGQFSRYIQVGAVRIGLDGGPPELGAVAFANPDGSLAVVVLNTHDRPASFDLALPGESIGASIPAHAIQTYLRSP